MKMLFLVLILGSAFNAFAGTSDLFYINGKNLESISELVKSGDDVQMFIDKKEFCYKGPTDSVANLIKSWNKNGTFFSNGGGGLSLVSVKVIRGFVTYDIALKFEDEVVPGEFESVIVKPCK